MKSRPVFDAAAVEAAMAGFKIALDPSASPPEWTVNEGDRCVGRLYTRRWFEEGEWCDRYAARAIIPYDPPLRGSRVIDSGQFTFTELDDALGWVVSEILGYRDGRQVEKVMGR